jgi:dihydrofolate reductase
LSPQSAAVFDDRGRRGGAIVTGRRTYDIANGWGGNGPLPGVPVFLVTHEVPDEVPAGSAPYTFVTEGVERAVELARGVAGDKDIGLMGATMVRQALRAGVMDEICLDLVPVLLGHGVRLLDGVASDLELTKVVDAPGVTHLTYRVVK